MHYALLGIWERFDTLWFLRIAEHGYDRPRAVTFYPLYPLTIRVASWAFSPIIAALLISTVATFFCFWGLLRLAESELPGTGKLYVLLLVSVWPTSFILLAGYAESLTLALIVWAVIFARDARWGSAAICGLMAGLGRPSGVLVSIPFCAGTTSRKRSHCRYFSAVRYAGLLGLATLVGTHVCGRCLPAAPGSYSGPALGGAVGSRAADRKSWGRGVAIELGAVILFAALTLHRSVRIEDKLFGLAVILQILMYTGRPLLGAMRYLLLVYPAFIVLGGCGQRQNPKRFSFYLAALGVLNLSWMWAFLNWSLVL